VNRIMDKSFLKLIEFIKSLYPNQESVPLHAPVFLGNEKKYLMDCIDSTFVSYVGKYVTQFENMITQYTGAKYAIAMVNGTAALQVALEIGGVKPGDEVITQALTFVATANAITHAGAKPVFIDVEMSTLGMSPERLNDWLLKNTVYDEIKKTTKNRMSGRKISAIVPMHTFGHPCRIAEIKEIADNFNINIIEDAAESLGSFYQGRHTGTFGTAGIISFNGNKIITCGGGGIIITDDEVFARKAKHISTTAKAKHAWEYVHDEIGYNYRLTNVSAAIGVAQMENLEKHLAVKRKIAKKYLDFCEGSEFQFIREPDNARSNYWLNAILLDDRTERDRFLEYSNKMGVMTRPVWRLMNKLSMFKDCSADSLGDSIWLEDRVVNIPSGIVL
jgi:perosamine synthetase